MRPKSGQLLSFQSDMEHLRTGLTSLVLRPLHRTINNKIQCWQICKDDYAIFKMRSLAPNRQGLLEDCLSYEKFDVVFVFQPSILVELSCYIRDVEIVFQCIMGVRY